MPIDHWCRVVMNKETTSRVEEMNPASLDVLEISGSTWQQTGFKSYLSALFPQFDICKNTLCERFDLIIAEQVFEHIEQPLRAAKNVHTMLRDGGTFLITTPFLIQFHPSPLDLWRWTAQGLELLLREAGFDEIEAASWGNKDCMIANMNSPEHWPEYDSAHHSLENEPAFPVVVWAFAKKRRRRFRGWS